MKPARPLLLASMLLVGGCVTFVEVPPGETTRAGLTLTNRVTWNQSPSGNSRTMRPDSRNWTLDGLLLDRLMIIPAVPTGESIFRPLSSAQALPVFRVGMLPYELQELVESSITKLFGEGGAVVETRGLRPQQFGRNRGIMFDLDVSLSDGPDYRGTTGAVVVDDKLYLIVYLAVKTYYYDKHRDEALQIIRSARIDGDNSEAGLYVASPTTAVSATFEDISGSYSSEITTNSKWQFLPRYKNLQIRIDQSADEITAVDPRYDTRISGTFDGEVIRFRVDSNVVSGFYEARGEWRLLEDGRGFDGHWTSHGGPDAGSGTWNLRRVE